MRTPSALLLALALAACGSDGPDRVAADTIVATDTAPEADAPDAATTSDDATTDDDATATDDASADVVEPPTFAVPPPSAIGDRDRRATLIAPASYDGTRPLPAVILLGGYWYYAWELDAWIDLSGRVDARDFVLVLPDGTEDEEGAPFWNATDTCCDYYDTGVDDVGYLTRLLDALVAQVNVDPARVSFVGHSNGAFMAYRMACEVPSRVAGVVSIAGSGYLDAEACGADAPISLLQVHGEDDDVMPIDGDGDAPAARVMLDRWGARAGCDLDSFEAEDAKLELVDESVADETTVSRFTRGCAPGYDVRFWSMRGSDHYPEFRGVFTDRVVDWILAHPRP